MSDLAFEIIEPNPSALIESLRAFGYSPQTAIADLVDNSISAGANRVEIDFYWAGFNSSITIADNGAGMSEAQLISAMTPGDRSPLDERAPSDLGRFGLGLKTASFSQCRVLTVTSKTEKQSPVSRQWDLDEVERSREWRLLKPSSLSQNFDLVERLSSPSWTVVEWTRCDRVVGQQETNDDKGQQHFHSVIEKVMKHLSEIFHRFIGGKRLEIRVNGNLVPRWDPYLESNPATQNLGDELLTYSRGMVRVTPFVLPHRSKLTTEEFELAGSDAGWNDLQGFYVYRQNRLLVRGNWLGLRLTKDEHYKLARIRIDISNATDEQWQIDVRKSNAVPPTELTSQLQRIALATRSRAVEVYRHRGKAITKRAAGGVKMLWAQRRRDGKIRYEIDREHPAVHAALSHPSQRNISALIRVVEETIPVPQISITSSEKSDEHAAPLEGVSPKQVTELATTFYEIFRRNGQDHSEALDSVLLTDPFHLYPEVPEDLAKLEKRDY